MHTWTPRVQEDYEQYRANGAKLVHFSLVHSSAVQRRAMFGGAETLRRAYLPEYQLAQQRSRGAHRKGCMHAHRQRTRVFVCVGRSFHMFFADLASTTPSSLPGHRSRRAGAGAPRAVRTSAQRALPRHSSRPSLPAAASPPPSRSQPFIYKLLTDSTRPSPAWTEYFASIRTVLKPKIWEFSNTEFFHSLESWYQNRRTGSEKMRNMLSAAVCLIKFKRSIQGTGPAGVERKMGRFAHLLSRDVFEAGPAPGAANVPHRPALPPAAAGAGCLLPPEKTLVITSSPAVHPRAMPASTDRGHGLVREESVGPTEPLLQPALETQLLFQQCCPLSDLHGLQVDEEDDGDGEAACVGNGACAEEPDRSKDFYSSALSGAFARSVNANANCSGVEAELILPGSVQSSCIAAVAPFDLGLGQIQSAYTFERFESAQNEDSSEDDARSVDSSAWENMSVTSCGNEQEASRGDGQEASNVPPVDIIIMAVKASPARSPLSIVPLSTDSSSVKSCRSGSVARVVPTSPYHKRRARESCTRASKASGTSGRAHAGEAHEQPIHLQLDQELAYIKVAHIARTHTSKAEHIQIPPILAMHTTCVYSRSGVFISHLMHLDVFRVRCKKRKSCCRSHPLSARKKLLAQSRLHGQGQQLTLQQSFRRGRKRSPPEIFIQAYLFLFLIFIHFIFNLFLRYFMELAELSVGTSPGEGRKRGTVGLMLWPAKNKELIITGKQLRSVQACLACMRCPSLRFKRQVLK